MEAELLEQVDRGQHRRSSSRTVAELIERWLSWRQQVQPISLVTVANYGGRVSSLSGNLPPGGIDVEEAGRCQLAYEGGRSTA